MTHTSYRQLPSVAIVGAGASGLWCALKLIERGWRAEQLQLFESDAHKANDRTFGYWTRRSLVPPEKVWSSYRRVALTSNAQSAEYDAGAYRYEVIRSKSFYDYALLRLNDAGVRTMQAHVHRLDSVQDRKVHVHFTAGGEEGGVVVDYVLDSRLPANKDVLNDEVPSVWQHFGGYFVRTQSDVFDPGLATFMDFVPLHGQSVAFWYVLPKSSNEALLELAVLDRHPWQKAAYSEALTEYLDRRYGLRSGYEMLDSEHGRIPMTAAPLWHASTQRIWRIGTAGGWVQPSSGYHFARAAKFAEIVADQLATASCPHAPRPSTRDQIFNEIMLRHVAEHPQKAPQTFYDLFRRNGAAKTFAFLDGDLPVGGTLSVMWNSPRRAFTTLGIRSLVRRLASA